MIFRFKLNVLYITIVLTMRLGFEIDLGNQWNEGQRQQRLCSASMLRSLRLITLPLNLSVDKMIRNEKVFFYRRVVIVLVDRQLVAGQSIIEMDSLLFTLVSIIAIVSTWILFRKRSNLPAKLLGPRPWPIIGNTLELVGGYDGRISVSFVPNLLFCYGFLIALSNDPSWNVKLLINRSFSDVLRVFYEKWRKKYGEIYRVWIGSRSHVVISSPELIEVWFNE